MRLVDYLMGKPLYLGVRVEIANRFFTEKNLIKKYNRTHKTTQLFDLYKNGKITIEKKDSMLVAHGSPDHRRSGLVNFSVMSESKHAKDLKRVVQIVNVLGNDRLIREKISVFVSGQSLLNAIPEMMELKDAFIAIDSIIPGFINAGWYYAPDAKFK